MTTFHERSAGVIPYHRTGDQGCIYLVLHSATVRNPRRQVGIPQGGRRVRREHSRDRRSRVSRGNQPPELDDPGRLRAQSVLHVYPPGPQGRQDRHILPRRSRRADSTDAIRGARRGPARRLVPLGDLRGDQSAALSHQDSPGVRRGPGLDSGRADAPDRVVASDRAEARARADLIREAEPSHRPPLPFLAGSG